MGKKRKTLQVACIAMFAAYFVLLFYFLFFAEAMGRSGNLHETYHYNLVPFKEIMRFFIYRDVLGTKAVVLNLAGNVVAMIPFGILMPSILKRCRNLAFVVFLSFELSLAVETIQLISKVGSFDVDDMILNTLGGFLGYVVFTVLYCIRRKFYGDKQAQKE